ncbi:hypothetical protein EYC84_001013 [Monilinia fructicola]|uniref:Uncharacterized protein n=1 Tax=Monilinia fructicola TaxID=38448 RepID=A0A5M9JLV6_MONFR|nr:hypothetical protein EYC84_001013 [Monilinia fructicola]
MGLSIFLFVPFDAIYHIPYTIYHIPYHIPYTKYHIPYIPIPIISITYHITFALTLKKKIHVKSHNLSIQLSFIKSLQIQIPSRAEQPFIPFREIYLKFVDRNVKSDHQEKKRGFKESSGQTISK